MNDANGNVDPRPYVQISDALARRMDSGLPPSTVEVGDHARTDFNALVEFWFESNDRPAALHDVRENAAKAKVPEHYIRNTTSVTFNASFGTVCDRRQRGAHAPGAPRGAGAAARRKPAGHWRGRAIRFDGPAQGTSRVASRRTTFGETVIEPGQTVFTLMAAANRDPEHFPRPDEIVLDRSPNQHLGFGWGPHACLGTMFGQLAVRQLVIGLLDRQDR
ncbi:cytochrome P450 [Streptomyces decoyicus]|uniref:cytochrome P450 n=1 Tax=Streptomyces decoyicus TaxID=249567 RepID=UPI00362B39C0